MEIKYNNTTTNLIYTTTHTFIGSDWVKTI